MIRNNLIGLESKLLSLADGNSNASIGLIGIADELRALEHELVAIDAERAEVQNSSKTNMMTSWITT